MIVGPLLISSSLYFVSKISVNLASKLDLLLLKAKTNPCNNIFITKFLLELAGL